MASTSFPLLSISTFVVSVSKGIIHLICIVYIRFVVKFVIMLKKSKTKGVGNWNIC
jgi:hypothetical protein